MPIRKPTDKRDPFANKPTIDDVNPHLRIDGLAQQEGEPVVARPTPLAEITPDPRQPRRVLPVAIRAAGGANPREILENWRRMASNAIQQPIDAAALIMATLDTEPPQTDEPLALELFKLYALASSIRRDGLLHPITVSRQPAGGYKVVYGERRFWSYNALMQYVDTDKYAAIPAQRLDYHDVWAQAAENTNRAELNAIEKARQLALLLMDMWSDEREFMAYEECASDLEFYAQAVPLNSRRGMGQRLLDAMGVTNRGTVAKYKKLLELPHDEWERGDAQHATLNDLLGIIDDEKGTSYHVHQSSYVSNRNITPPDAPTSPLPRDAFLLLRNAVEAGSAAVLRTPQSILTTLTERGLITVAHGFATPTPAGYALLKVTPPPNLTGDIDRAAFEPTPDNALSNGQTPPDWATNDPDRRTLPLTDPERPPQFEDARSGVMVTLGERVTTPSGRVATIAGIGADENFVTVTDEDGNDTRMAVEELMPAINTPPLSTEPYPVPPNAQLALMVADALRPFVEPNSLYDFEQIGRLLSNAYEDEFAVRAAEGWTPEEFRDYLAGFLQLFNNASTAARQAINQHIHQTAKRFEEVHNNLQD